MGIIFTMMACGECPGGTAHRRQGRAAEDQVDAGKRPNGPYARYRELAPDHDAEGERDDAAEERPTPTFDRAKAEMPSTMK